MQVQMPDCKAKDAESLTDQGYCEEEDEDEVRLIYSNISSPPLLT